jgi:cytochrome c oxidase cbb3-type subunit 3
VTLAVVLWAASLTAVACEREARSFAQLRVLTANADTNPFQENAWGIAEGKRLYDNFNCVGCHSHGGGGMGPPLMDDKWIYGHRPAQIFETIVEGRPNGMPSFRDKLTDAQVWQIAAYVQSMTGQAPFDALPSRSDHLRPGAPENARPAEPPVLTGKP